MAALQTREHLEQQDALGETLALVVRHAQRRRRVRGGARGLIAALAVDILLAALARADVLPDGPFLLPLLAALAVLGAGVGAYWTSRFPLTLMDAARLAEARLPLKERLSSALEFGQTARVNPLLGLQHADAEAHARALDMRLAAPRRIPREAWLVLPLLLALALTLWLPMLPFGPTPAQRAEREVVQQAGRALAQDAHQAARQADARHQEGAKRQAQQMETLGKRMAQGHMDRAQALAAVSQQEQQLAPSGQSASPNPRDPGQAAKDLAGAAKSPAPASTQSPAAPKGASASAGSPRSQGASAGRAGPQKSFQAAQQAQSRTGQQAASRPPAQSAAPPKAASTGAGAGSPEAQKGRGEAAHARQPSNSASAAAQTSRAAETTPGAHQPPPSSSTAPEARQALENARRRLAGPAPSGETPASKPGATNNPSPSPAGAGKPSGQGKGAGGPPNGAGKPGAGPPNGQSQSRGGPPNGPPSPAGKGQAGHSSQGKPTSQSLGNPGGAPGQPAPGGGAGQAAKFPFRGVLPPTIASKGRGIALGTPGQNGEQGKTLHSQSGQPPASAGPSRVPYSQALPRYRKRAEAALDQEQVPPSQRAVVRDYFNSLQPAK